MSRLSKQLNRLLLQTGLKRPKQLPKFPADQATVPSERRMIILGNAPMQMDMSEYIDSSDVVVRFNECQNYGLGTGHKADILCINNFGQPAEEWIKDQTFFRLPFIDQVKEIWLPRTPSILEHRKSVRDRHFDVARFRDLGEELVNKNRLTSKVIERFSDKRNAEILDSLKKLSSEEFREPSTGILAIAHAVASPRFAHLNKVILGFTFEGWKGHPWKGERALIAQFASQSISLHLMP